MDKLNTVTADVWRHDSASQARSPAAAPAQGGPGFASVLGGVQGPPPEPTARQGASPQDSPNPVNAPDSRTDNRTDSRPASYTVRNGDSLSSIAQEIARQRGLGVNAAASYRLALDLAAHNQIRNPDLIVPGQQLQLDALHSALDGASPAVATATAQPGSTQNWLAGRSAPQPSNQATASTASATPSTDTADTHPSALANTPHPVLAQTLERAVARGFIPAQEKQAVQGKILQLAQKYQFAPDDFARMTLMESDGMNPRASNQRCHGIIQFCDGPNRGAAAVGYGQQPRAILGLSVYQQLHLVDNYFQDNGLGKQGPAKLDDLYLTVLQPAARQQKQAHVPLNIPGPQARDLHVGANTRQAITRQSIVEGLLRNTREKLNQVFGQALGGKADPLQIAQNASMRQNTLR